MVNPNTKGFDHFTDEAFYYGWCENCGLGVALTDKEEIRNEILEKYHRFKKENACEPHYANCRIVQRNSGQVKDVRIMLSPDTGMADDGIFFYCHTLERLIGLSVPGRESFTLTECFGFALLTDREKMERQVFKHEADGKPVIVTGREVLLFYGEHYGIRPEELKQVRNGVLLPYQTLQGIWISVAGQVPREKNAGGRGTDYKRGNTVIHSADTLSLACENHQRG